MVTEENPAMKKHCKCCKIENAKFHKNRKDTRLKKNSLNEELQSNLKIIELKKPAILNGQDSKKNLESIVPEEKRSKKPKCICYKKNAHLLKSRKYADSKDDRGNADDDKFGKHTENVKFKDIDDAEFEFDGFDADLDFLSKTSTTTLDKDKYGENAGKTGKGDLDNDRDKDSSKKYNKNLGSEYDTENTDWDSNLDHEDYEDMEFENDYDKNYEHVNLEEGIGEFEISSENYELENYYEFAEIETDEDLRSQRVRKRVRYGDKDYDNMENIEEGLYMDDYDSILKSLEKSKSKDTSSQMKDRDYGQIHEGEKSAEKELQMTCPCRGSKKDKDRDMKTTGNVPPLPKNEINDARLGLFLKKNEDNTGSLILQGKDMDNKFKKRIQDSDMYAISRFITHHRRRINVLDLRYNEITDVGFFILLKKVLVKERSCITDLNIMNNNLTDVSMENLRKYAKFIRLEKLRINGNLFGTKGGEHFAFFLLDNKSLEYADISQSDQTFSSLAPIVGALRKEHGGNCTLKALDLSRIVPLFNRYHLNTRWLAYHIELLLLYNNTLTDLYLQRNELLSHDMEYLQRGLKVNRTITCLDLGYNRIGDYGADLIASLFKETPLLILNLAGNSISDYGARAISFTLPFSKIRAIDLSNNHFTDKGVLDILNTIKKPNFSRFLNIWGNKFGHRSCVVIDRMMLSKVLCEHTIDVRVYEVDDRFYAAYCPNPIDRSKYLYFWKYGQVRDMIKTRYICTCRPRPKKMYCMPGPDGKLHYSPRSVPKKCVC